MYSLCLVTAFLLAQVTQGVVVDHRKPYAPCCFGDETFEHGEVVLSLQRVCLQLVCQYGKIVRRYLGGKPGQKDCCEFDGQLYSEADKLVSHCVTLQCRDSCWFPQLPFAECCSRCSLYDDPHIETFDGVNYDFHGDCNYTVTQRGFSQYPDVGVFSDFEKCNGDAASCLFHTTFRNDPHTVISLTQGAIFYVEVNGHPVSIDEPEKVYALQSSEGCHPVLAWRSPWGGEQSPSCLTLFGSSRIMIQHCPNRMDILAHPSHTDNLHGLCGHFNYHEADDFTSRNGKVFPLVKFPYGFPTSWRTEVQSSSLCKVPCSRCDADSTRDPCKLAPTSPQTKRHVKLCSEAITPLIRDLPQLAHHIDDCVFDLCVMSQYTPNQNALENWVKNNVVEIVKMAVYFHKNTEGSENGGSTPTTESTKGPTSTSSSVTTTFPTTFTTTIPSTTTTSFPFTITTTFTYPGGKPVTVLKVITEGGTFYFPTNFTTTTLPPYISV